MRLQYGWVVVAAGALMGCVAIGSLFSLAVFLQPMSEATGWSRTGISFAMTLDFLTMGVAAFGWGALTDRFGPRPVVLAGAVFAPTMATVTGWFVRHRSIAVSLVSAGMGMGPMTISPLASWLLTSHDWRTAQLTIAVVAWALLIPAALFMRRAPETSPGMASMPGSADPGMTVGQALRSPQFLILGITYFFCC